MDLENISIESISAWQQAQTQLQFGVKVLKSSNDQMKVAAAIILDALRSVPPPESGKGQRLNVVA